MRAFNRLSRLHLAIEPADERKDTSLPRDLESRIFSYFDQMQATREEAAARRSKGDKQGDDDAAPSPATENTGG